MAIAHELKKVNNAILSFQRSHPFLKFTLEEFVKEFDPHIWGHQGPQRLTACTQQAYRCTNVPIQEIRCKWIRILNWSKWAIYYEILTCSFWDMSTLILSQVFLKTTFRMGLGDFLLGYVIIGIFWWYIALFGTGKINYMIEITMEKVKFYNEFEIMEKRHLYPTMGKIHQTICSERYFSQFYPIFFFEFFSSKKLSTRIPM